MAELEIKPFRGSILLLIAIIIISTNTNNNWLMMEAASVGDHAAAPPPTTLTLQFASLFPLHNALSHTCTPSSHEKRRGASLDVRQKHGPCSPFESNKKVHATLEDILEHDESRIKLIRNRINPKKVGLHKDINLPAKSGNSFGYGNFVVTVGLGTPRKDLILAFDTGSSLTWAQCEPCEGSCYQQKEAIFDPSKSSTYSNISCHSQLCNDVRTASSTDPDCFSQTCVYTIQYEDTSISRGYLAKDTLYLSPQDAVPNFYFGCGQFNVGLFRGISGLLGLSSNKFSAVSQTASSYGNYFSYCLPFNPTSTGHLTLGKDATVGRGNKMQYTPLVRPSSSLEKAKADFYYIELEGISVEGERLGIAPTVFSRVGTIIDSGTVITQLPMEAYNALKKAFTNATSKYKYPKPHPASKTLDTCYDFSRRQSNGTIITIPIISLHFGGGARMDLPPSGIFYGAHKNLLCLAFRGTTNSDDVAILGNTQQLTFDILYDLPASRLGFASAACL